MAESVTHRSLDGTRITLSGPLDLSLPPTAYLRVEREGRLHELVSGDRESARDWARLLGVEEFTEEFSMQGGRLRIGESETDGGDMGSERVMVAAWEGAEHAVYTQFYFAKVKHAIRFFDSLSISEHHDGITVEPRPKRGVAVVETGSIAKLVPGIGLLEIMHLNRETGRHLPGWKGTKLDSGEIFRDEFEEGGTYYVLSSDSAIATIVPGEADVKQAPGRLNDLTIRAAA